MIQFLGVNFGGKGPRTQNFGFAQPVRTHLHVYAENSGNVLNVHLGWVYIWFHFGSVPVIPGNGHD